MSDEPSLLEAFRTLAPLCGTADADAKRAAAARVLLRALQRIAQRSFGGPENRQDAVNQVLESMLRNGPRGVRPDDPDTDEGVRVWLSVAWAHKVIALERGAHRFIRLADVIESLTHPHPGVELLVELRRLADEIEAARRQLYGEIAPLHLSGEVMAGLREIAEGRATVNDLVAREEPKARKGTAAWTNARNRIDQRNRRAIRSLRGEIRALRERAEIDWLRWQALEVVAAELQVRKEKT